MYDWIRRVLSRPRVDAWIIVVATLLVAPALFSGLAADDFVHELALSGQSPIEGFRRSPFDLFRFAGPDVNDALVREGVLPWWTDPTVRFAFLRPLASATHVLDHALGAGPFFMHVHSLGWALLTLLGARALFRTVEGRSLLPTVALCLYALDDARGPPVAWVANRNELIACALSVWAVTWHARQRAGGGRIPTWLAPLALGVSLLASEGSIAVTPYLFAHALWLDEGPLPRRLARLLPFAGVVVVWAVVYRALGYGVVGSGVYFDPVHAPGQFLRVLPERFAMLWLAQLGGPWSEGWNAYPLMFPGAEVVVAGLAVVALVTAGLLFAPLWRSDPRTRFWLTGATLATLPACGAFPADRLLPWVGLGAMAATAQFFTAFLQGPRPRGLSVAAAAAAVVVAAHLVAGPLLLPLRSAGIAQVRAALERADRGVPHTPDIAGKVAIYLNPPADPFASYIPITRAALGVPRPRAQAWLTTGTSQVHLERLDAQSLSVRPEAPLLVLPSELLLRDPETRPFRVGDTTHLAELSVTVTAVTTDGRPAAMVARFARPLEDPVYLWRAWQGDTYAAFTPPAVGQRVVLPAADLVTVAYGADSPVTKALQRH